MFWFGLVWGFFGGLGLGCILMQAEQAREWFHDVSLVEERKVVSPLSVVACVSASCSAWSNWPLLSCPLCWLVLLSSVMCWVNQLCVCGVSQDINPKEIFIFFFFLWISLLLILLYNPVSPNPVQGWQWECVVGTRNKGGKKRREASSLGSEPPLDWIISHKISSENSLYPCLRPT